MLIWFVFFKVQLHFLNSLCEIWRCMLCGQACETKILFDVVVTAMVNFDKYWLFQNMIFWVVWALSSKNVLSLLLDKCNGARPFYLLWWIGLRTSQPSQLHGTCSVYQLGSPACCTGSHTVSPQDTQNVCQSEIQSYELYTYVYLLLWTDKSTKSLDPSNIASIHV